jgi:poly(A) polymerase
MVASSTVVFMPPPELWQPIVDIKRNHMNPRIKRPPYPHITLLAPFVEQHYFDQAAEQLRAALADIEPFRVDIPRIEMFDNRSSFTVYLEPHICDAERAGAFEQIYDRVVRVFPASAQKTFTPHIGIAFTRNRTDALQWLERYQRAWQPMSFEIKEVYINSRIGQDEPFEVRKVIPLGSAVTAPLFDEKPLPTP